MERPESYMSSVVVVVVVAVVVVLVGEVAIIRSRFIFVIFYLSLSKSNEPNYCI